MKCPEIRRHPHIQPIAFERLVSVFGAIENILHLHYASHTGDPLLSSTLQKAGKLCLFRIGSDKIRMLLGFDSTLYVFGGVRSVSTTTIGLPSKQFTDRKSLLIHSINQWISENTEERELPLGEITESTTTTTTGCVDGKSRVSVSKPRSNRVTKLELQNTSSKFKLASKDIKSIRGTDGGLLLLERIREKERLSNLAKKSLAESGTPSKEQETVDSKLVPIYNILYQLGSHTRYLMERLVDIINDSLQFRTEGEIVHKSVAEIANRLEAVKVTKYNDTLVVTIHGLARDDDLRQLLLGRK